MKNKLIVALFFWYYVLFSGCEKNNKVRINIDCNGNEKKLKLEEKGKFKCSLLGDTYVFTIKKLVVMVLLLNHQNMV